MNIEGQMIDKTGPTNWDERYGQQEYYYGTAPNSFLVSVCDKIPARQILCLAEGEGRNSVFLASRGYQVTAVDGSSVGLRKAAQLAADQQVKITIVCADLAKFEIEPGQWDGIVSCYCHLPPAIRTPLHQKVVRGLRPGGVLVLEGFSKQQLSYGTGGPPSFDLLFALEELQVELAGLEFMHAVTTERDVREGLGHSGIASVVQILAVKPTYRDN
jgi:SAM-dependent methyltransferase